MSKKELLASVIIGIIIILGIILIFVFNKDNIIEREGPLSNNYFEVNGYGVEIKSDISGHPSGNSYFNTSFEIEDEKKYKYEYIVDVIDLEEKEDEKGNAPSVNINGKKYYYNIDEENNYALLEYYTMVSNKSVALKIKITGTDSSFDEKGNSANVKCEVNTEVLESKELASILNLSINSKK